MRLGPQFKAVLVGTVVEITVGSMISGDSLIKIVWTLWVFWTVVLLGIVPMRASDGTSLLQTIALTVDHPSYSRRSV